MNWCVEDPDSKSDVSAEDGRMSELALLEMKQLLEGPLWEVPWPFLGPHDVMSVRSAAKDGHVTGKYGPCGVLFFFFMDKEPNQKFGNFVSTPPELYDCMRVVEQESVLGYLREYGIVPRSDPVWSRVPTQKGCLA